MNKPTTLSEIWGNLLKSNNSVYLDSIEIESDKKGNKQGHITSTNESELTFKFESHCEDYTAYYKINSTYKLVKVDETVEKIV